MTPYIISYFTAGLFLAIGAWLNGAFASGRRLVFGLMTILLWPLIAVVAPDVLFRKSQTASPNSDSLKSSLQTLLTTSEDLRLSEEEAHRLTRVVEEGESNVAYLGYSNGCEEVLEAFWDLDIPPSVYHELKSARRALQEPEPDSGIRFSLKPPDWYIGFSNEFLKSISKVDRRNQGRVLEAIRKIGDAPITIVGDTIVPLTGNLAGLWRCRVGNDRLIYFPHPKSQRITLISFGSRGKIYENVPNIATLTSQ